ncbi:F-box domain containing protein [Pandoravirus salinus]|uniref:F-box domain containing protein n=1 Tax=Pandoravirus salinus TaxID=1349410 RepID=S4VXG9_9VIRU|nr:F-box domain [Pandoravirus salinus]AGO85053.1 F-box domain containing protein [Pandoravirus salinus]
MDVVRGDTDATTCLPDELWHMILNGADARGVAFLPPSYRVAARMTCSRWRLIVSTPSATDRVRLVGDDEDDPDGRLAVGAVVTVDAIKPLFARCATFKDGMARVRAAYLPANHGEIDFVGVDERRDEIHSVILAAAAATGISAHLDAVAALLGDPPRDTFSAWLHDTDTHRMADVADAVYEACVCADVARGVDMAAPFLGLDRLTAPVKHAIRADDLDALSVAVRYARRAVRLTRPRKKAEKAARFCDSRLWTFMLKRGTPTAARVLVHAGVSIDALSTNDDYHEPDDILFFESSETFFSHYATARWHESDSDDRDDSAKRRALDDAIWLMRWAIENGDSLLCAWTARCYATRYTGRFGPLDVDEAIVLALRSGTYRMLSRWFYAYVPSHDMTSDTISAALATVESVPDDDALRHSVEQFFRDWAREIARADGGRIAADYLFRRSSWMLAWAVLEHAPPVSGPLALVDGLWKRHTGWVHEALAQGSLSDVCSALTRLCWAARRWGFISDAAIAAEAVALNGRRPDRHPWARALVRVQSVTPDARVWRPWVGVVAPLSSAVCDAVAALSAHSTRAIHSAADAVQVDCSHCGRDGDDEKGNQMQDAARDTVDGGRWPMGQSLACRALGSIRLLARADLALALARGAT